MFSVCSDLIWDSMATQIMEVVRSRVDEWKQLVSGHVYREPPIIFIYVVYRGLGAPRALETVLCMGKIYEVSGFYLGVREVFSYANLMCQ